MIDIRHLTRRFDRTIALDDVSFEVHPGEIVALTGELIARWDHRAFHGRIVERDQADENASWAAIMEGIGATG